EVTLEVTYCSLSNCIGCGLRRQDMVMDVPGTEERVNGCSFPFPNAENLPAPDYQDVLGCIHSPGQYNLV
ncbi:hypothetical protein P7K49_028249, partial [Saguinus oedipus]